MPATPMTFTLVLTKGVHLISPDTARAIQKALEAGERTVLVALDPLGDVANERKTLLAVQHVVAITENESLRSTTSPEHVSTLSARQSGLRGLTTRNRADR